MGSLQKGDIEVVGGPDLVQKHNVEPRRHLEKPRKNDLRLVCTLLALGRFVFGRGLQGTNVFFEANIPEIVFHLLINRIFRIMDDKLLTQ